MVAQESSKPAPSGLRHPGCLIYSIMARIGGYGLDLNALEALKLSSGTGYLGQAFGYGNRQKIIPSRSITSLDSHPVRLLSFLSAPFYYDAKKKYLDRVVARHVETGQYDFFHGWAGNCVRSLHITRRLNIPSVLEIPTWHRDKGKVKPREKVEISKHEKSARWPDTWFTKCLVSRQDSLEEYDLADLLLVPSECSARTFTAAGIPGEKLFRLGAGVDTHLFRAKDPASVAETFSAERPLRAAYCGALIRRKGVPVLLEAWRRAALPHAELTLIGAIHDEVKPALDAFGGPDIKPIGFSREVHRILRDSDVHVFPSECEGSAKTVYEACAAGLAQITTFESGDVVQDGLNGLIVPCHDVDALATALRRLYDQPALIRQFSAAARHRAETELTWDHFRARLARAYDQVLSRYADARLK
jgi:glycosyltransferase involved in cell wall biosynthesis